MNAGVADVWTARATPTPAPHVVSEIEPDFAVVLSPVSAATVAEPEHHEVSPAAAPATPVAPRPKLLSEWPFDERLHVHASVVSLSGGPFDAAPLVPPPFRSPQPPPPAL